MTTAKPPARYGAIGGARPGGLAVPSYTTSGDTTHLTDFGPVGLGIGEAHSHHGIMAPIWRMTILVPSGTALDNLASAIAAAVTGAQQTACDVGDGTSSLNVPAMRAT